jgi:HEAT repeat protein
MLRVALLLAGILVGSAWVGTVHGQDDDPLLRGKRLSEWLAMLRGEKDGPFRQQTLLVLGGTANPAIDDILYRSRRAGLIAAELIGPIKSRKVFPAILEALRDDADPRLRDGAAQALGKLAQKAKAHDNRVRLVEVRDGLTTALRMDRSASVRQSAAAALGVFDPESRSEYRLVHDLLPSLPVLLAALRDPAPEVSNAAAETIRRMGPDAKDAVAELDKILKDPKIDPLTRAPVAQALGKIGAPDAVPALATMKEVLADPKTPREVRAAVAESLGKLGRDAGDALPVLGMVLTSADTPVEVRRSVATALGELGADARPALPALKKAIKDEDKFVRCFVMRAMGQMGKELGEETKEVVTALLRALDDSVIEVRVAALETFGNLGLEALGDDAKLVQERMEKMSKDPLREVREAAENALKKLKMS